MLLQLQQLEEIQQFPLPCTRKLRGRLGLNLPRPSGYWRIQIHSSCSCCKYNTVNQQDCADCCGVREHFVSFSSLANEIGEWRDTNQFWKDHDNNTNNKLESFQHVLVYLQKHGSNKSIVATLADKTNCKYFATANEKLSTYILTWLFSRHHIFIETFPRTPKHLEDFL